MIALVLSNDARPNRTNYTVAEDILVDLTLSLAYLLLEGRNSLLADFLRDVLH